MKTNTMQSAVKAFFTMTAAGFFLTAGSAAAVAQGMSAATNDAIEHCGCDSKQGIGMYVQNLINDAKQRGMSCETARMHTFACITSYCSICKDHPGLMENCIKNGAEYFASSGFCQAGGKVADGFPFMPPKLK